ncbi:MAG: F0F1 ATP synthase subunit B [Deltaproteobacteria bacterium]|nr:F0F1 ATP synthase subunit B [Deltaproteobacteria bacterium]
MNAFSRSSGKYAAALLAVFFLCSLATLVLASDPAGEHAVGEAASHGASSEKLWDLLYRTVCFGVVFFVLFFLLRKPLPRFLSDRRATIKRELDELEKKRTEGEAMLVDFKKKVQEIEKQREVVIAEYVKEGEAEKAKIIEQAKLTGRRIEEQARWAIQQEIKKAKMELQAEVADLATAMAEDIIRKNMNKDDEKRLVDEYIAKVVETA